MNNNYSMPFNSNQFTAEQLQSMYPEVYNDLYPFVMESANDIRQRGYAPTQEMINSTVDSIIKKSGMWDEDEDMDPSMEAVPVQLGFGGQPFRRRRRRHHNRNTLRDIVRILLLRELLR